MQDHTVHGLYLQGRTDFVNRVEKSILSGQVPERTLFMTKDDNSTSDPVLGYSIDVVYEYVMPVVVKRECAEDEDEDVQVVMVAPVDTTRRPNKLSRKKLKQEHPETEGGNLDAEERNQLQCIEQQHLQQQRLQQQQREAEEKLEQQHLEQQCLENQQREAEEKLEQQRLEEQQRKAAEKLQQQQHETEEKL